MVNYNGKKFKLLKSSSNSEIDESTIFHYHQEDFLLYGTYNGKNIKYGNLIGKVAKNGEIDMRYHQMNDNGELMTGICYSKAEINEDGKIILHEKWQWTSGDKSKGTSMLIEIAK
ncbi:MAG: hypothetical protein V3V00_02780 [Saprospiraceae bacterium]